MKLSYALICAILAAQRCKNAGWTVEQIARDARVPVERVKKWLGML